MKKSTRMVHLNPRGLKPFKSQFQSQQFRYQFRLFLKSQCRQSFKRILINKLTSLEKHWQQSNRGELVSIMLLLWCLIQLQNHRSKTFKEEFQLLRPKMFTLLASKTHQSLNQSSKKHQLSIRVKLVISKSSHQDSMLMR